MRPLRGLQEPRVATREESGVLGFPSRRGLTPRGSLECNTEIPAFPGDLFVVAQSLSHVWLFVTPWTVAGQASVSVTSSRGLLKLMSIESVMPSNHRTLVIPFSSALESLQGQRDLT